MTLKEPVGTAYVLLREYGTPEEYADVVLPYAHHGGLSIWCPATRTKHVIPLDLVREVTWTEGE